MAIKKIDDIYIDGKNRAWGGYIHSVSYEPSFGEGLSSFTVEVANESGVYDIDKNDLRFTGSPSVIRIGSKITLYMYPVSYNYENSPSGRTLRVDYVDESVAFLDKTVVKLKTRGLSNESYPNTIVVGVERKRDTPITEGVESVVFSSGSNSKGPTNTIVVPGTELEVTDVDYVFGDLLDKIASFVARRPSLDASASSYRKDYSGRLREVLSAWCNDFGLGFYWENRKLNFIDLRNPANISAVEAYFNSIKTQNNVQSESYGFSIRDTFTRGVEVFFGKDGEILRDYPSVNDGNTGYSFTNIRLRNLGVPFWSKGGIWQGEDDSVFGNRIKSAYYGEPALIVNLAAQKPVNDSALQGLIKVEDLTDTAVINSITNGTSVYTDRTSYKWKKITFISDSNTYFEQLFSIYNSYAKFYGRFYWKKLPTLERARILFGQEGKFYDEWLPLKQVDIFKQYLEPIAKYIPNYSGTDPLTLRGFIEGTGEKLSQAPQNQFDAPRNGYLIMEIQPVWDPEDNNLTLDLEKYVIIEGSDSDPNFFQVAGDRRLPVFYFGLKDSKNPAESITLPTEDPVTFTSTSVGGLSINSGGIAQKIEYTTYVPPQTANVNYYELSSNTLSEEDVLGASAFYYQNLNTTKQAFDKAAADLIKTTQANQTEPFFTASLTVPNIDLVGTPVSVGNGLLGLSVTIGADGVSTTYKFGNEKMRIRNSDIFFRYFYDPAKKKQRDAQIPNIMIRKGRARRVY